MSKLEDFERDLRQTLQTVQKHYAALFESVPELTAQRVGGDLVFTGVADDPATAETLEADRLQERAAPPSPSSRAGIMGAIPPCAARAPAKS